MTISPAARRTLLISFLLALATLTVYWPVRQFEFVHLDDDIYVTENARIQRGLTWDGIRWAFTNHHTAHWLPLVWISFMIDIEWHGLDAGGFHLTNLLLHIANAVVLFLVFQRMTGSPWRSAWVAAVFALHPLRVESVAWVTERKDVLSGLFWWLAIGAYGRYAASYQSSVVSDQLQKETERGPRRSRSTANRSLMPPRRRWYALTLLCFTLGLLAKPMVVTLPFVLLLLDYWPLRRWPALSWGRLVREKLPVFALAVVAGIVTFALAQHARVPLDELPLGTRLVTAVVAYASYLGKMIWPTGLACYYPHPGSWPPGQVALAGAVLAVLTALAWWRRRHEPALVTGWCWYLGTLVPVSGISQVGTQAMADRFTYIPLVGIGLALAWGLFDWWGRDRLRRAVLAGVGVAVVAAWAAVSARQVWFWRDSFTLFEHTLARTEGNWVAHSSLGVALTQAGRWPDAIAQYEQALRINPRFANARNNLGMVLARTGQLPDALRQFEEALRINPQYARAHYNLGLARAQTGALPAAVAAFEHALRLQPDDAAAHNDLAIVLTRAGRLPEAIAHYEQALRLQPDNSDFHYNLGATLLQLGRAAEAVPHLQQGLPDRPDHVAARVQLAQALQQTGRLRDAAAEYERLLMAQPDALGPLNNLAWLRATAADPALRDGPAAVRLAERAVELTGRRLPEYLDTLAAAYAEAGRWPEAVTTAEQALALARAASRVPLATEIGARLEQYRARQPWREPGR